MIFECNSLLIPLCAFYSDREHEGDSDTEFCSLALPAKERKPTHHYRLVLEKNSRLFLPSAESKIHPLANPTSNLRIGMIGLKKSDLRSKMSVITLENSK
jgi:hypothetical protein